MTSEAQSILNQVKSIADSPDIFEVKKVNSIIDIFQDTDWNILEEAYDELLKIIFSFENNHGPSRGGLYGHLLKKKVNAEHSSLEGNEHYNYIEKNIDFIINNNAFRQDGKTWAIGEAFVKGSDIVISEEEFYKICEMIFSTDEKVLVQEEKRNILSQIGLKVAKTQPNIAQMIQNVINIGDNKENSLILFEFCVSIWQGIENDSNKASQLAQVYKNLSNTKYVHRRNEKKALLSLIQPFDSNSIGENIDILIAQINSIDCDKSIKQLAFAKLYLSVDKTEENASVLSTLRDELEKIQQSDKGEEKQVLDGVIEKYDTSTPDRLMDSIVYQELADINIIDDWKTKSDIQKRNIINSIESLLQSKDPKYAEDGYIMRFIQVCKHKVIKMEEKDTDHLISLYDTYLSGIDNTNSLEMYEKQISEGGRIDSDKYQDFETQVAKYRCKGARLPRPVYNYILSEALHERISRLDQASLIQSAIVDLTCDVLECLGRPDYFVYYRGNMAFTAGARYPYCKTIEYNVDAFNKNHFMYRERGLADFVSTAYHEPRHAWQELARTKGYLNKRIYKMSQEDAIRDCNQYFYEEHYSEMEVEIDARIFAAIFSTKHLLELGFSTSEIAELIDTTLDKEIESDKEFNRGVKKSFDGQDMTTVETLQQVFSSNPNKNIINRIFERNPLLSLEYRIVYSDEDELKCNVERRSNEEIEYIHQLLLSRISDDEDKKNVDELFDYIINGEKESKHSEFTTGEYLNYYGYDANWSMEKLSRMSPCLCDYQLFKGKVNNDLVEEFPGNGTPVDPFAQPEV
jgi:hypothetical protein